MENVIILRVLAELHRLDPAADSLEAALEQIDAFVGGAAALVDVDPDLPGVLATHVGVAVENARLYWSVRTHESHVEVALRSRDVIGTAKGILMQLQSISPDQAFEVLRQRSSRDGVRVAVLAQQVVDTGAWAG